MATEKTAITLTREELYALVWQRPLQTVGKEFGVSGNAVAKVCKKLRVPVPGRGYWAKRAFGHCTRRLPLSRQDSGVPAEATIDPRNSIAVRVAGTLTSADGTVLSAEVIEIPDDLRQCHPLISATRKALSFQAPNQYGLLVTN